VVVVAWMVAARAADPPGTPMSRRALELCHRGQDASGSEQVALFDQALAVAEQAVAENDGDALGHFAVFCSLGGKMQAAGPGMRAFLGLRRLRREVDRTLELAPDYADALAGKGALLLEIPRLLGGDPKEAERLLRRAIAVDPGYLRPRLHLVQALVARGARAEARAEAVRALEIARRGEDAEAVARVTALLAELGPGG
jgi:tetratricopeptide (TPR) repeat protein